METFFENIQTSSPLSKKRNSFRLFFELSIRPVGASLRLLSAVSRSLGLLWSVSLPATSLCLRVAERRPTELARIQRYVHVRAHADLYVQSRRHACIYTFVCGGVYVEIGCRESTLSPRASSGLSVCSAHTEASISICLLRNLNVSSIYRCMRAYGVGECACTCVRVYRCIAFVQEIVAA